VDGTRLVIRCIGTKEVALRIIAGLGDLRFIMNQMSLVRNDNSTVVQFIYAPLLLCKFSASQEKVPKTFYLVKMLGLTIERYSQEEIFVASNLSEIKIRT